MQACPICHREFEDDSLTLCPNDGSLLYAVESVKECFEPGTVIAGNYKILEEIPERGGAGRTFKVWQMNLERTAEMRILPKKTLSPSEHGRFRREVDAWSKLQSDYWVHLYDAGFTEQGAFFIVLELVHDSDGAPAREFLQRGGPFPLVLMPTIAEHALLGLSAAHREHIVHRDISPDSLILISRADGGVHCRLTGLGFAKPFGQLNGDVTCVTQTGQLVGHPSYMAPEAIMDETWDERSDLYALGVTLYELMAGQLPFEARNLEDCLSAHVEHKMTPLKKLRRDADERFCAFIEKLMARRPEDRYQNAEEALVALHVLQSQPKESFWHRHQRIIVMAVLLASIAAGIVFGFCMP